MKAALEKLQAQVDEGTQKADAAAAEVLQLRAQLAASQSQQRALATELAQVTDALVAEQGLTASLQGQMESMSLSPAHAAREGRVSRAASDASLDGLGEDMSPSAAGPRKTAASSARKPRLR